MLGTGADGPVREPYASAIAAVNATGRPVLAVDLPSGLDCDTGLPLGAAVRARKTVTFIAEKVGFTKADARCYTGRVQVVEIGIPRVVIRTVLGG